MVQAKSHGHFKISLSKIVENYFEARGHSAMDELIETVKIVRENEFEGDELIELTPGEDQRDFLEKVVRSPRQPMQRRVKCAEILMAYKYPKFGAVAIGSISRQDFATLLDRAIRASNREAEVKLIEAKVASEDAG